MNLFRRFIVRRFLDAALRTKIILVFLLIALTPIGILAYLNYQTTRAALTQSANQTLFAAASQTATRIDSFISTTLEIIHNSARLPDLEAYLALADEQREQSDLKNSVLQSLLALKSYYIASCAVLDLHGNNLLDTSPANIGKNESDRRYFQMTLNTRGDYVSPVEFPKERGSVAFYFSSPISRNSRGTLMEIIGVLRISYNVAIFQQIVAQSTGLAGAQSYALLLNEHALLLAHGTAPEFLFKTVRRFDSARLAELQAAQAFPQRPPPDLYLNLPAFEHGLQNAASQPFFIAAARPAVPQTEQIAVVKLTTQPWSVAFVQPRKVFLAPVNTQTAATLGLAVMIAIGVIALAIGLIQVLTIPITRLTRIAEQIAGGNFTAQIPLYAHDEIGKLSGAFNNMTVQLRQTLAGLEQRNQQLRQEIAERQRAEAELREHQDHLEEMVKARTRELTVANQELQQEILERKRIETELQSAKETAEVANQAKSEFISHVSHELRTPLNAILGYTQLLRRDQDLTDKQHAAVATIHRNGEYLLLLITDLLDLSKIEARKIELIPTSFPFPQFLRNLVETARIRARQKGIGLDADFSADLPAGVSADERRLRQILINLLNNAIKFTDKGSVSVRVYEFDEFNESKTQKLTNSETQKFRNSQTHKLTNAQTRKLRFEIADTGIGILAECLQLIFRPFYQVGGTRAKREGSGLGLAISQQLVRLMGSELYVKSTVGQGTTFWFDLTVRVTEGGRLESGEPLQRPIIGFSGARRKILLVDDNHENRALLRDTLSPLGFEIVEAGNGQEALSKIMLMIDAQQAPPDLILMDLFMPVLDGFEAIRRIRQTIDLSHVRVIAVSASVSAEIRQESIAVGCDDFLAKPVRLNELLECLRLHLQLEWIYAAPAALSSAPSPAVQPEPLSVPPPKVLAALLAFAEGGYMTDIQQTIANIKTMNAEFSPFADRIEQFADNFQFDQIIELINSTRKGGA